MQEITWDILLASSTVASIAIFILAMHYCVDHHENYWLWLLFAVSVLWTISIIVAFRRRRRTLPSSSSEELAYGTTTITTADLSVIIEKATQEALLGKKIIEVTT